MAEIEIGRGKSGRRGFDLTDVTIVPSRRTRDPSDVDLSWKIDAYRFAMPLVGAGTEQALSTDDAVVVGERGGLPLLDLEALVAESSGRDEVGEQLAKIKAADLRVGAAVSPGRAVELLPRAVEAEVDMVAILGPVVSAEHVSVNNDRVNLKTFIRSLDVPVMVGGCASYSSALHLMRTGAAGIVVGADRPDLGVGVPLATAIADARAARVRHLDETGVYCQLIARGPITSGAQVAAAVACGADAVMVDASVIVGPDPSAEDLAGDLREAMAVCGYTNLKDFQKAEVMIG